ncbi:hypothetical protein EVAR_58533_1 [Eumeta japonica]|uniref:Uncharacterized protein n=1 Tax=Eumeta variegata TaxID=151549 RepID=A0A4C1Z758_EUMVA|nr:hypothetical protein EVAR_58533_1 [Eumeta japonica]
MDAKATYRSFKTGVARVECVTYFGGSRRAPRRPGPRVMKCAPIARQWFVMLGIVMDNALNRTHRHRAPPRPPAPAASYITLVYLIQ